MKALLIRAAELLEQEAECLLESYTIVDDDQRSNGPRGREWDDSDEPTREAHESYDEMVDVAGQLRSAVDDARDGAWRIESAEMFASVLDSDGTKIAYFDSGDAEYDRENAQRAVCCVNGGKAAS